MKRLLLAGWIAPMDSPVIREGGVVCEEGVVVALGAGERLKREYPDAVVEELGEVAVLPGLVNAHVHLEMSQEGHRHEGTKARSEREGKETESECPSCLSEPVRPPAFVDWLKAVITRRVGEAADVEKAVAAAVAEGVGQCRRFGVTSVGDISRMCQLTRPILARCPLRVVSYGEVQGMGQRRGTMEERLAKAADGSCVTERLRIGITPHAPYSIEPAGYARCLEVAQQKGLPLATHLAESADEAAFLAEHSGPFRELWSFLGWWDEQVPRFAGGPIRLAASLGLLDYPTLLAHVNYCSDEELDILSRGPVSVVYCPRTHAYFGHPPHRWREMLKRGINVAVGTDSCASSPDLNLVDDLRLMHQIAPEVAVQRLWEMATIRAARAISEEQRVGSITPGKAANMVAFAVKTCDPLTELLESDTRAEKTWIGGVRQMTND